MPIDRCGMLDEGSEVGWLGCRIRATGTGGVQDAANAMSASAWVDIVDAIGVLGVLGRGRGRYVVRFCFWFG